MPKRPQSLAVPVPDPATLKIIDLYARRRGLDRHTAAEHLIAYGARAWYRARTAGKARSAAETPAERTARARSAANARWANRPVPPPASSPISDPE